MSTISDISLEPLTAPKFVKTQLMHYKQNGIKKFWEIADVHDSVSILIYHKEKEAFILVKQLRPAVYLKNGEGFTYELCAGICDKEITLAEIASEEILEECGYEVSALRLERITAFYTAVGFAGSSQTLYYAEVDESMKVGEGGGVEHEAIEVIELSIHDAEAFIYDEKKAKTPGIMFSLMWWFQKYKPSV